MFNKTIFKQDLKSNFKLWLIITIVLSVFNAVLIGVFDPKTISSMADMVKDTPLSNILGNTTFLGMLAQTFYSIQGVILPLIFIISTASSLIVAQVDKGSMAYLLSTPTKRGVVVRTQAIYFITALVIMFTIVTGVGFLSIQAFHGGVWSNGYTKDVKEVSKVLNLQEADVADDLGVILNNREALEVGAQVRETDEESYMTYLNLKIAENAYQVAADLMNIELDEITQDPTLIKNNEEALEAAAKVMGLDSTAYSTYLDTMAANKVAMNKQSKEMQDKLFEGLVAASEVLDIEESELASDMGMIKTDKEALDAAVNASQMPEEVFMKVINNQIAIQMLAADKGIDFSVHEYAMLNLGLFLLMFATSGISFMFSCIFNLSKNYMALGGGIPLAFFLFHMMAQVSDSLKGMKYITLNSLFDTQAILNGGDYWIQFIAMVIIGIVFYIIGIKVFEKKDLPL